MKAASTRSSAVWWCWSNSLRGCRRSNRATELAKPCLLSLSLSPLPHLLPLSLSLGRVRASYPRHKPRWRGGPEVAGVRRGAGSASLGIASVPVRPVSPCQFLYPLLTTRVAGKSGPACWRCRDPGHFIDRCPVMEVGTLVRVPDAPQAAPDQAGIYQIPVSIKGGYLLGFGGFRM